MENSTLKIKIDDILDKIIIDIREKRLKGSKVEVIIPILGNRMVRENKIKDIIDITLENGQPLFLERRGFTFMIYNDFYNDKVFIHYKNIYINYELYNNGKHWSSGATPAGSFRVDYKIIKEDK